MLLQSDDSQVTEDNDIQSDLRDITFGALARAQDSLDVHNNSKKRKRPSYSDQSQSRLNTLQDLRTTLQRTSKIGAHNPRTQSSTTTNEAQSRTSKHAPTSLTSKRAVSRKRTVFSPPPFSSNLKSRDPRFDAAIVNPSSSSTASHANKNYSFLTTYRTSELAALQSRLKNSKKLKLTPEDIADTKRDIMSLSSKQRQAASRAKEREILQRHKREEKQAIREGRKSKPFFLKQSQVRKEIEEQRKEGMGKKAREKSERRKRKKEQGKEMKMMPMERRS